MKTFESRIAKTVTFVGKTAFIPLSRAIKFAKEADRALAKKDKDFQEWALQTSLPLLNIGLEIEKLQKQIDAYDEYLHNNFGGDEPHVVAWEGIKEQANDPTRNT